MLHEMERTSRTYTKKLTNAWERASWRRLVYVSMFIAGQHLGRVMDDAGGGE
jgi:hypothetical protein